MNKQVWVKNEVDDPPKIAGRYTEAGDKGSLGQDWYDSYLYGTASGSTYAGTQGQAVQKIWWDNERGDLDHYIEEFVIYMYDTFGNTYAFRGTAHGEVTEYKSVNDKNNLKKLQKKVEKYKLDNISVKQGEKGLTISLDAIQFEPDSDVLRLTTLQKLRVVIPKTNSRCSHIHRIDLEWAGFEKRKNNFA